MGLGGAIICICSAKTMRRGTWCEPGPGEAFECV
jgi:hypothetical protein